MSSTVILTREAGPSVGAGLVPALGLLGLAAAAALLAGWAPLAFSMVTVFLFAGPHNWAEARYFLGRLPARAGKLFGFFAFSFAGIVGLTAALAALPWLATRLDWVGGEWLTAVAVWNSALIAWVVALIQWRAHQNPRRAWGWTVPVAFLVLAVNWLEPLVVSLALVYLHPLMALWILDRELRRSRPGWRRAYHLSLLALPLLALALWWKLHAAPQLPGDTELAQAIARHAGSDVLAGVSSHFLVALHTFLEMVHYGVWLVAIPLIGWRSAPWRLATVPAARRSPAWRRGVAVVLLGGLAVVLLLWLAFLADYTTTRNVYFTIALLHVLAEVPFLLRAL
jgi:hypothetical protein